MVLIAVMKDGRFVPVKEHPTDPSKLIRLDLNRDGDDDSHDDEDDDDDDDDDNDNGGDGGGGDGDAGGGAGGSSGGGGGGGADVKRDDEDQGKTFGPYDPANGPTQFNIHDLDHVDEDKMKADAFKVKEGGPVTTKQIGHAAAVAAIRSSVDGSTSHDYTIATAVRNAAALFHQKEAKGEITGGGEVQAAINVAATAITGIQLRYEEDDFEGLTMGMFDLAAKFMGLTA
ncbi:hypothetical protein BCV69DRAFT_293710 [Microstroma glucosiphilum]|uniref:Uncharacterized protein n=1 Tax=Pseudomicrostroma glucosiphilum TaxID=1684307 RepID=A0A316U7G4_9BASI|nr:hypothetical protein BCV69DRAFT_293710 [Pseudomicrostroma glucosiphilum]PWN21186.1 hypothetical protein BCV69DRAFT_293710 [Pseudomicrostroma glucosiphilum]